MHNLTNYISVLIVGATFIYLIYTLIFTSTLLNSSNPEVYLTTKTAYNASLATLEQVQAAHTAGARFSQPGMIEGGQCVLLSDDGIQSVNTSECKANIVYGIKPSRCQGEHRGIEAWNTHQWSRYN